MSEPTPATVTSMIRPMRMEDAERVAELAGQLGYPSSAEATRERYRDISSDPQHGLFVAEIPGVGVVGWIHLHVSKPIVDERRAEIWGLVIDESHRNRGLGRLMMEHAERWSRKMGCLAVLLRSNVIRDRAHAFYEKEGYRRVKSQHVFQKEIEPSP